MFSEITILTPLSQLVTGQSGTIKKVLGTGKTRKRLLEMGFIPGTEITVKKRAPLADPVEFVLLGYHISLRREEAASVITQPC
jgi:Fe2+ transport system protein FeoA